MESGGLISYSTDDLSLYRRAATYVDKILKGAKPADLPVEQPMKFEFVANLKTAKQIGVTIPPNVLAAGGSGDQMRQEDMRATEAGSHRASGHRIENAPLSEYQMSPLALLALGDDSRRAQADGFIVILHDQNQLGGDDLSGKVKLKVEPLPTSLSTQILPPCSSTNFLAKVNPSPVPSTLCA